MLNTSGASHQPFMQLADGSTAVATTTLGSSFNGYLRVIVTTSGSDLLVNYSTSSDGVTYTALGTQVTAAGKAGQIGSTSRSFRIGARSNFHDAVAAEYLMAQVYDSTDTLLFDFNPNLYNRATNQTSWTASTSETYTLSTATTATGLKSMIIDQTMLQYNGTSHGMQAPSLAINTSVFTQYDVWRKYNNITVGIHNEFGANLSSGQGLAFIPNDIASTETVATYSNVGLNANAYNSNNTSLKVSIFEGDIAAVSIEQNLRTNDVQNTFNATLSGALNTANIVATGQNIGARNNAASLWLNMIYVGDAMTITTDTSTERANFYNLLATESNII